MLILCCDFQRERHIRKHIDSFLALSAIDESSLFLEIKLVAFGLYFREMFKLSKVKLKCSAFTSSVAPLAPIIIVTKIQMKESGV